MHLKNHALTGLLMVLALALSAPGSADPAAPATPAAAPATPATAPATPATASAAPATPATAPATPATASAAPATAPAAMAAPAAPATDTAPAAPARAARPARPHEENAIVAIVNDTPITSYELQQRIALVMVTTNIPNTPEMQRKVREQVLEQLETEVLQRQEAQKNDITVSSVEVDHYLQGILDENHMTKEQLQQILARGGVQLATFRAQLAAQILWQKAVQEHYAGRVNISTDAVDAEMARIREGAGKAHFTVSEIFLAVENPEQDERIKRDAQNLVTQLHAGGQFASLARQFSQSASAAQGGDIGTVYDGQLAPELNAVLVTMHTGDISAPIRSTGGYFILQLRQRYEPAGTVIVETQPSAATLPAVVPLGRVLLRLPPNPPHDYLDRVTTIAKQIQQVMNQAPNSCELAAKMPQNVPGSLYFALGPTRISDLNQQTRDALAKTEVGGVAEPFRSDAGIEIFARCEQRIARRVAFPVPTREQVEQALFSEQISALARRYNRDLRRSANIETR